MATSTQIRARFSFRRFDDLADAMTLAIRLYSGWGTKDVIQSAVEMFDCVRRVNFWPRFTVTVWLSMYPRPTRQEIRGVKDVLKTVVPAGFRTRVMAIPSKYGRPLWQSYTPLEERVQMDIERLMIDG